MGNWVRRIKGVIGMGITWAVGWIPVGALFGAALSLFNLDPWGPLGAMWFGVKLFAVLGLIGGSAFSVVLQLADGRLRFDELSLSRFAAWGAIGGLLLGGLAHLTGAGGPGFDLEDVFVISLTTLLGTASAVGTLAIARRADDRDLLAASEDVGTIGLTEQERQNLLKPSA